MTDEKAKGFRVIDKRRIGKEDAPEEKNDVPHVERKKPEEKGSEEKARKEESAGQTAQEKAVGDAYARANEESGSFQPDFTDIVKSFFMQALASLGMLEGEGIQPGPPNLDLARQYIDLLGVLEQKTRGNLSREEESLLREYLAQVRMVFVKLSKEMTNKS
jgi:hypothetical protein